MAPAHVSKEAAIGIGVSVVAGAVILAGVYNKEKTKELYNSAVAGVSKTASAAATKSSDAFKAVQSAVSSSYTTVVDSFSKKLKMRRVRSFPVVIEEDVQAVQDQTSKKLKKAASKKAKGVPVQVTAN